MVPIYTATSENMIRVGKSKRKNAAQTMNNIPVYRRKSCRCFLIGDTS